MDVYLQKAIKSITEKEYMEYDGNVEVIDYNDNTREWIDKNKFDVQDVSVLDIEKFYLDHPQYEDTDSYSVDGIVCSTEELYLNIFDLKDNKTILLDVEYLKKYITSTKRVFLICEEMSYDRKPFNCESTPPKEEDGCITFYVDNFTGKGIEASNYLKNLDGNAYEDGLLYIFNNEDIKNLNKFTRDGSSLNKFNILDDKCFVVFSW